MSMNQVWRLTLEPSVERDPATRIRKPFTHPQAQEINFRRSQLTRGVASTARERNNTHTPSALCQTFGDCDYLPLCSAKSIERRDQGGNMVHCAGSTIV
jgi:hypothetical protein